MIDIVKATTRINEDLERCMALQFLTDHDKKIYKLAFLSGVTTGMTISMEQ
jgi:hypothetical protein